jgi:hypothetical protein
MQSGKLKRREVPSEKYTVAPEIRLFLAQIAGLLK